MFLQILQNLKKTLKCQTFFLTNLQRFCLQRYLKRDSDRCFPVNLSKFLRTSTLQNTSRWLPLCFVSFSEILVIKVFWMILHYFKSSSCKLSLIWLSQSLSAYCYLKMLKFLQCHCQSRAPWKRSAPSINDYLTIVDIFVWLWFRLWLLYVLKFQWPELSLRLWNTGLVSSRGQSYLIGRRSLFSLGWSPF